MLRFDNEMKIERVLCVQQSPNDLNLEPLVNCWWQSSNPLNNRR
jgi:hypothetical protein